MPHSPLRGPQHRNLPQEVHKDITGPRDNCHADADLLGCSMTDASIVFLTPSTGMSLRIKLSTHLAYPVTTVPVVYHQNGLIHQVFPVNC